MSYLGKINPKIKLGMAILIAECVIVIIAREAKSNMINLHLANLELEKIEYGKISSIINEIRPNIPCSANILEYSTCAATILP